MADQTDNQASNLDNNERIELEHLRASNRARQEASNEIVTEASKAEPTLEDEINAAFDGRFPKMCKLMLKLARWHGGDI